MVIDKSKFFEVIKNHPKDYEKYCAIKDEKLFCISMENNLRCQACNSFTHTIKNCHFIKYLLYL